jgi:DNA polymerase-3 subunit gamma/tau
VSEIGNQTDLAYRNSINKRLQVELALIKMCSSASEKKELIQNETNNLQLNKPNTNHAESNPNKDNISLPKNLPPVKKSGVSLNNIANTQIIEEENEAAVNYTKISEKETIDEIKLDASWKKFVEKLSSKPRLYNALKTSKLSQIDDFKYELLLANNSLEQTLENNKSKIIDFMKKELNNQFFDICFRVKELDETNPENLYTEKDKYKYLLNKNPNLDKLKNDFDLDFS